MPNPEHQLGPMDFSSDVLFQEKIVAQTKTLIANALAGDRGVSLLEARRFYQKHADILVPSSVDRWAQTQKNGIDVHKARQKTLRHIFAKDLAIAEKFKRGIETKGTIFQLTDYIKEGIDTVKAIEEELKRRTSSQPPQL